jgi:fumarate hydratase class II
MTSRTRLESDSMGTVEVPSTSYWGAQTQRSIANFPIGRSRFQWQRPIIKALGILKRSAAVANQDLGELPPEIVQPIIKAADEVIAGTLDAHFPLVVFQTGSGTQSNMNANEVISNRAIELISGVIGSKTPIHPNDHVNRGQSSNDAFPTAMYIAVVAELHEKLFPSLERLRATLASKAATYGQIVKTGRTHLQDATPITLGQEIGAWVAQIEYALNAIKENMRGLYDLAIGGTAVGTGLNAHPRFGEECARRIAELTGHPFRSADNKFFALSCHDALVNTSAAIRTLAMTLLKVANDVRWLASGPRCGIGEITIPENEPGSSIMPGKVNPTQCEALTMVCAQVFGNDATVAFAGSQGNFQLNVYKPIMVHDVLESVELLSDACDSFTTYCAIGIEPNFERIENNLEKNLMLVTGLNRYIGYDKAAIIAKTAHKEGKNLREVAIALGFVTPEEFDRYLVPLELTHS